MTRSAVVFLAIRIGCVGVRLPTGLLLSFLQINTFFPFPLPHTWQIPGYRDPRLTAPVLVKAVDTNRFERLTNGMQTLAALTTRWSAIESPATI